MPPVAAKAKGNLQLKIGSQKMAADSVFKLLCSFLLERHRIAGQEGKAKVTLQPSKGVVGNISTKPESVDREVA